MADFDVTQAFKSGLDVEESFIELKMLLQSYSDLSGDSTTPLIFTLEKAFERFELVFSEHQRILHLSRQ